MSKIINVADVDKLFVYGDKVIKTYKYTSKNKQGNILQNKNDFDDDSKRKLDENPLRILDSKSDFIQGLLNDAPKISEFICFFTLQMK